MLTVKIPARQLILPLRVALFIVAVQKFEISTNGASWTFSDCFYTEQTVTTIAPNLISADVRKKRDAALPPPNAAQTPPKRREAQLKNLGPSTPTPPASPAPRPPAAPPSPPSSAPGSSLSTPRGPSISHPRRLRRSSAPRAGDATGAFSVERGRNGGCKKNFASSVVYRASASEQCCL